jgi:hypothetical protein
MDPTVITESPFGTLTFIVAPALLTNASSVLAMSTINRMLRTRDRMFELYAQSEAGGQTETEAARLVRLVNRVEKQGILLLRSLHSIYVALGAFAGATLVTLLGASMAIFFSSVWVSISSILGIVLGILGVGGLVFGSMNLLWATRLSLINLKEEAKLIRKRQGRKNQQAAENGDQQVN